VSATGKGSGNRAGNKRRAVHWTIQARSRGSGHLPWLGSSMDRSPRARALIDVDRILKAEMKRERKAAKRAQTEAPANG